MPSWFIAASQPDYNPISSAGTYCANLIGGFICAGASYESFRQIRIRDSYTLSKMYVRVATNEQTGTSTVTSRKNGADGNLTVSIGAGLTGAFTDDYNSDNLVDGDLVNVKIVVPSNHILWITLVSHKLYCSTNSVIQATTGEGCNHGITAYSPIGGLTSLYMAATETHSRYRLRVAATMSNFRVYVGTNTVNGASTARTRKNYTNGNQSVSIPAATTGDYEDTTHTDSIASGDRFNYQLITGGTSGSCLTGFWQVKSTCTRRHVMNYDNAASESWPSSTTYYMGAEGIRGASPEEATVEANVLSAANCSFNASYMYCNVITNALSTSTTVKLRKNGADSTIGVSISGGSTGEYEDTTHTVAFVATDTLNWKIVTGSDGSDEIAIVGMGFQLESTGSEPTVYSLSKTDGIKLDGSSLRSMVAGLSRSDGLVAGSSLIDTMAATLLKSDGLKVGDARLWDMLAQLLHTEGVKIGSATLADTITAILLSLTSGLKIGDSVVESMVTQLLRADGTKVGDTTSGTMTTGLFRTDGLTVDDILSLYKMLSRADGVTLSDSAAAPFPYSFPFNFSDSLIYVSMLANLQSVDGVKIGSTGLPDVLMSVTRTDGVKLTDLTLIELWGILYVYLTDGIKMGDTRLASMIANLSKTDSAKLGDSRSILTALLRADGMRLDDSSLVDMLAHLLRSDGVKVSDSRLVDKYANLLRIDGVKLGDSRLVSRLANLLRTDGVKLDDSSLLSLLANLGIVDGIKLSGTTIAELVTTSIQLSIIQGIKIGASPTLTMLATLVLTQAIKIGDSRTVGMLGELIRMWLSTQTYHDVTIFTEPYHCVIMSTETFHNITLWTGGEDMTIRRDWQKAETVPIWAEVRLASTGALYDPDQGVTFILTNPSGTAILTDVAMTKDSLGKYVYYWNSELTSASGWYRVKGKAQDGSGAEAKVTIEYGGFLLQ